MKTCLLALFACLALSIQAQNPDHYFPPADSEDWETISFDELGWCEDELDTLLSFLDSRNTKAFIVLYKGKIAIEQYFDTFTQDSVWTWNSAGKTLTAFSIGLAQEQGLLDIEDPTSDYLGEGWTSLTPEQEAAITVRNQLTMTSGLSDLVPDVFCTDPECLIYETDPDERWAYHNGPYTLLTDVISEATGMSETLYLFSQLNATTGFTGLYIPLGYNRLFISKARSMARFGLLIQNQGNWDGTQIMTDMEYFEDMVTPSQEINESYGYLWWLNGQDSYMLPGPQITVPFPLVPDAPDDLVAGIGADAQLLHIVNSEDIVLIRMGQDPDNSLVPIAFNTEIWQLMNNIMCESISVTESLDNELLLGPNPTTGMLTLSETMPYTLYDRTGRFLLKGKSDQIDLNHFGEGLYLLNVGGRTHRIVVQ